MRSYGPFPVALPTAPGVPAEQKIENQAAKVVFMNMSPYTLYVNMNDGKNPNKKILPFVQDIINVGPQFNGDIDYLAAADIGNINSSQAPSSILYIESFGPAEPVPGVYPSALPLLTVVGNTILIANQVQQTGQTAPTPVLQGTPQASLGAATLKSQINNDGSSFFGNTSVLGAAFSTDTGGNASGHNFLLAHSAQETGKCGDSYSNVTAGQTVGPATNYKSQMTNTPTSITLNTPSENSNANAPVATDIDTFGFWLAWSAPGVGTSRYVNTYTTVGN